MLFSTAQFALFFALLLLALRVLPRRSWNGLLLSASLLFYGLWIPVYLPLLLVDVGVNYALLRGMLASAPGSARRRWFFAVSVLFTLSLLLYFKYAVFLLESALPILRVTVGGEPPLPDILLPLGISFYTFQIISLAADLFPGRDPEQTPRVESLARYTLFISFFPQLVAGPILRGGEFLPQLAAGPQPNAERNRRGLWLIASGVGKKIVLADFLLAPLVELMFDQPGRGPTGHHWVAMYAFSFQVYFDFSGYTDIARGVALLIGYELPENFHEPFLSRSPHEFWQRWHITLSRWLRLYLFTPISHGLMRRGGPRWDAPAIPLAQLVTMTVCGLWHGAGWNFVLWGALQGVLLAAWRFPRPADAAPVTWRHIPAILLFYNLFCLTLVFFRTPDVATAAAYFDALFAGTGKPGFPVLEAAIVAGCVGLHVVERWARGRAPALQAWFAERPFGIYLEAVAAGLLAGLAVMMASTSGEFIYFQF